MCSVGVSTDDQRDNGYSIDSQLRMIKEYCEKNDYSIVDVYNDAGHSGKDLMRPEMQRLLADIVMNQFFIYVLLFMRCAVYVRVPL
jgi:site-specific DNA recombinase